MCHVKLVQSSLLLFLLSKQIRYGYVKNNWIGSPQLSSVLDMLCPLKTALHIFYGAGHRMFGHVLAFDAVLLLFL